MKVAHWAVHHTRSILFLLGALVVGGIFGARSLPVSLFPHVNFPRIRVDFDAGDRPAERMAVEVTVPVEECFGRFRAFAEFSPRPAGGTPRSGSPSSGVRT